MTYINEVDSQPFVLCFTTTERPDMATSEEIINRTIGKTIARKRKAAGFTQHEVADKLGIGAEAFSRIERGAISAGIFKLYEMADMFECGVETFLIEGSRRPSDQAEYLLQLIGKLSAPDRQLIISIVERLSRRLGQHPGKANLDEPEFLAW
jgi:transcriptional regulator with XRE-family HTH domain